MNRYFLKEYGSWGVMTLSFMAGLIAGRGLSLKAIASFAAISLFINSKQAFTLWIRSRGQERKKPLFIFAAQILTASSVIIPMLGNGILPLLPYTSVPIVYLLLLKFRGEHAVITEIAGFILLSMSALVAKFTISSEIDPQLFLAVAIFFTAGVFKVRLQFQKKTFYRTAMIIYVCSALLVYKMAGLSLILLLPLVENIFFAVTLYRAGLSFTGWAEMLKGILFLALMSRYYA